MEAAATVEQTFSITFRVWSSKSGRNCATCVFGRTLRTQNTFEEILDVDAGATPEQTVLKSIYNSGTELFGKTTFKFYKSGAS